MAQPSPVRPKHAPEWLLQFGRRLLLARGRAGLTQKGLAAPDLSKSFISLLESGRSYPSMETIGVLARRVNSSIGSLLLDPPDLRLETALNLLHVVSQMEHAAKGDEAVALIVAAERVLPDMPVDLRIRAALLRARVAMAANRLEEATRRADEAVSLARRHQRSNRLGMALGVKGEVEVRRRSYKTALPLLQQATTIMQRVKEGRTEENLRALISLGTTRYRLEQLTGARTAYLRALEVATRLNQHALRGEALTGLGAVEWARRRLDAAGDHWTQAYDVLSRAEDLTGVSRALSNLGMVRREQGRLDEALKTLQQALRVRERLGDSRDRSATLDAMGQVLLGMGRHAEANRAARRAIREAQAGDDRVREAEAQMTLARVLHAQGRAREAIVLLRGASAMFRRLGLKDRAAAASKGLGLMISEPTAEGSTARPSRRTRKGTRVPQRVPAAIEHLPG